MQSASIGLPLLTAELPEQPTMLNYENEMQKKVAELKYNGYNTAVFGDIFLEDLKRYREEQMTKLNMNCLFPIWKRNTRELMDEFLSLGFKAIIVCVNGSFLDKSFCGRMIDASFVADLPATVDICGENGEYHSFVFDGPIFSQPIPFTKGEVVHKEYNAPKEKDSICTNDKPLATFYFCDLLPH
jgi:uncharacterized protein (TIGR00290 family)